VIESLEKRGSGSREGRLTWLRQWESPLGPPVVTAPSLGCAWLDGPDPPGGRREKASEYDRYFAEIGTRRDSAVASAGSQVGPSPWTLATPGSTQCVPRSSSDPSLVPPQFKKPRTPPPRTVVATTRTEMYLRHTSQDVTVNSPSSGLRRRHVSSSSTSSGSRIPGPPQTSPRSSVQQWLDALDTQVPPPPTPVISVSQPVSMQSGVTSSMPLWYSASQMAAQRVRSSRHSQSSRRSRFSTTSATVIQAIFLPR